MTKTYNTRVQAPAITQPEVNDACSQNLVTNDAACVNPSGPCLAECRNDKSGNNNLLSCKNVTNVATHNVRSLRKDWWISFAFNKANLNILGIVDHNLVHEEETLTKKLDKCKLITSSAWRNSNGASNGGVGLLLNKTTESALADIKSFNGRILIAHFQQSNNNCHCSLFTDWR